MQKQPKQQMNVVSSGNNKFNKLTVSAIIIMIWYATSRNNNENVNKEYCGVYLKPESAKILNNYLATRGIKEKQIQHIVKLNTTQDETNVLKLVSGQRVAFRLNGIMQSDDGHFVATGRISDMRAELRMGDKVLIAALLLANNNINVKNKEISMNMPFRYSKEGIVMEKEGMFWKGSLPAIRLSGVHYPAMNNVTFIPIPKGEQIILEGFICNNRYVDEVVNCLGVFDRFTDKVLLKSGNTIENLSAQLSSQQNKDNGTSSINTTNTNNVHSAIKPTTTTVKESKTFTSTEVSEDIAKFMKAGPCKKEFNTWDACVKRTTGYTKGQLCFTDYCQMLKCMRKHEYYDFLTAGTDFNKLANLEKAYAANSHSI